MLHPQPHDVRRIRLETPILTNEHLAKLRHIKRQGRLWIRVFPDVPVSKKPAEVRQGKGKGSVEYWAARVKPGRILFELDGVPGPLAATAFERAAMKLPIKTKVVARLGDTTHLEG